jgi:hypothetical protein
MLVKKVKSEKMEVWIHAESKYRKEPSKGKDYFFTVYQHVSEDVCELLSITEKRYVGDIIDRQAKSLKHAVEIAKACLKGEIGYKSVWG